MMTVGSALRDSGDASHRMPTSAPMPESLGALTTGAASGGSTARDSACGGRATVEPTAPASPPSACLRFLLFFFAFPFPML